MISPRFNPEALLPEATLTVTEAVARYLSLRTDLGMVKESDTYRHLRKHLQERLCGAFGTWPIADVRLDHLREWIKTLRSSRSSEPVAPLTQNHHVKDVKVFFKRARLEGWIQQDPSEGLQMRPIVERDVNVISAKDAFEFFKKNRDTRAIGRLALEAFGGLRYTTAGKIGLEDLKFDCDGIEMPSTKHKSKKRKFRQGQPENLWLWLRHVSIGCWSLTLRQYAEEKKEMLILAGLRPLVLKNHDDREKARMLKNVWRHSFATYLSALTRDFSRVGYLMQHTSTKTTQIYEGMGSVRDARLYFAIAPDTVLMTWEEFLAAHSNPQPNEQTQPEIQRDPPGT